jgi:hypothetical protein
MRLSDLYRWSRLDNPDNIQARELLEQTHWFVVNAEFDPKTGKALPQALSPFLAKIARPTSPGRLRDRLWRIAEHARPSVERLLRALHESPRREHALLPVRAVRELDANSFIKLSNRPGRNIREKLGGKPYLQAVRRFQSVDLSENRLLKAFITRLAELFELRQDCLGEEEDELLPKIKTWLRTDDGRAIARWDNPPPNNVLLSHRDYRRVWDAWRSLQRIDDDIDSDFSQLAERDKTMRLWKQYAQMHAEGSHRFAEMPVLFNFNAFAIDSWLPLAFQQARSKVFRPSARNEILDVACLDLAALRPSYATSTTTSAPSLGETYLWQHWKNGRESVSIALFQSDAAILHPDATSISSEDLFFSREHAADQLDTAARAFVSRLRETFKNDTLIWLVPDFLNDFELEIARRNINARFPNAEPLPRSIAAVFEQVDYSKVTRDGLAIAVVDTIGGQSCVTRLIARFDPELKRSLPVTNGVYWERCPPLIISNIDTRSTQGEGWPNYDIATVDGKGQWFEGIRKEKPRFIDPNALKGDPRIGPFAFCINLTKSPVIGGTRLHALQQRAGDIPLWRDQIPELSIKVMKDGRYRRFYLVSRGTTVKPVRGLSVSISVSETFTLRAGRPFYQFPLFQGENAEELGFSARLDSPAFPLKTDAICKLRLAFAYGADEPYKLTFIPLDESFPAVRATWRRTIEEIVTDAPAPSYPTPMSWADLRRMPKPDGKETSDLLDWVLSAVDRLDSALFIRPQKRLVGEIDSYWHEDKNGAHYTFVRCDQLETSVFIHEHNFVEGLDYRDFEERDAVSFVLEERAGKFTGRSVAKPNYQEETRLRDLDDNVTQNLQNQIHKSLYVPFIKVWSDGRSLTDTECPKNFADGAKDRIAYLNELLSRTEIPRFGKNEFLFLLACLHKDTTDDCVQWVTDQVESGNIRDPQAIGFALGNLSEAWQQYLFSSLASKPNTSALSVLAYAIWREQHFVENFSISELQATLNALSRRLANIQPVKVKGDNLRDKRTIREWVRATAEPLELLLGLLRTRASKSPEIRMILQPQQEITKQLAQQVEKVAEIFAQSNVKLFSRVQLNLQKPPGDRTPDLLYALRLFLTGDDGANAIHITSISDSDND